MVKLLHVLCVVGGLFFGVHASKEVACKCNNKTIQIPDCGMCGSESGKMEKTGTGVACFCENNLKFSENECDEVCSSHGGWSGDFVDQ
ncbi:hypothetical protein H0W26_02935 [Candidatus Dependentiae bacterium]|nr:hypothetical protein [Candidatus Dependentiae bacterium]